MRSDFKTYQLNDFLFDEEFFFIVRAARKGDKEAWEHLLSDYPEKEETMQEAFEIINAVGMKPEDGCDRMLEEDWKTLQKKMKKVRHGKRVVLWLKAAACLLILVTGTYLGYTYYRMPGQEEVLLSTLDPAGITSDRIEVLIGEKEKIVLDTSASIHQEKDGSVTINEEKIISSGLIQSEYIQVNVPYGKRSSVVFSDGTKVWMNSGTKLRYPASFKQASRDIFVDGEVYLEVMKDVTRPFVVHTNKLQVQVLGTSFNLTAYSDDSYSNVVLVNGKVNVLTNRQETFLKPNQCLHYEAGEVLVKAVDVSSHIGWKDGFLKLDGDNLGSIFKKLSRYYNIDIRYSQHLADISYEGKLDLNEGVEKALEYIALTEQFIISKENNTIKIVTNN